MTRVLMLSLALSSLAAAQEPSVTVELSAERVFEGQPVECVVTVHFVDDPPTPDLAELDGFRIEPRGQESFRVEQRETIGGRSALVEHFGRKFTYRLTPLRTGKLSVPAPVLTIGGRQVTGEAQVLEVLPADAQDVVRMEIAADPPLVYPGQPFTVTLTVRIQAIPPPYNDRNPVGIQRRPPMLRIPWAGDADLPDGLSPETGWLEWLQPMKRTGRLFLGFGINDIEETDGPWTPLDEERLARFLPAVERGGRQWVYRLSRTFQASRPGRFLFGPATLEGKFVPRVDADEQPLAEEVFALARPVEVLVQDVPQEGRPESYSGAIGQFQLAAELSPTRLHVGDPATLVLTVAGRGTLDALRPPDLRRVPQIAERFRVHDAAEQHGPGGARFVYNVRPLRAGVAAFPAVPFSYFDYATGRYVTIRTEPIPLRVGRAERLSPDQIVLPPGASGAGTSGDDFPPAPPATGRHHKLVKSASWFAAFAALVGACVVIASRIARTGKQQAETVGERRRRAPQRAAARAARAEATLAAGNLIEGVGHLWEAMSGLAVDVAGAPEAGLATRDLLALLREGGLPEPLLAQAAQLLDLCDAVRYGGFQPDPDSLRRDAHETLAALCQWATKAKAKAG